MGKASRAKREREWTPWEETATVTFSTQQRALRNNLYTVFLRLDKAPEPFGECVHLSVKRNDGASLHDWRDLQRIKNEILGPEVEAVEIYPAESRLVDLANQYHLWAFPNFKFPFGFMERMVLDKGDPNPLGLKVTQRPMR